MATFEEEKEEEELMIITHSDSVKTAYT